MQRATRKSNPRHNGRPQPSAPAVQKTLQAQESTPDEIRAALDKMRERAQRMANVDAHIERKKREGITLKGKRLEQAERIVSDCTMAAISTKALVVAAICADGADEAGAILTALENQSMWITRRLDVLANLLGSPGAGNFLDKLEPLTEERAAELEAEEVSHAD